MIPFAITMLVFLLGIYYLTIMAHFFGASVFGKVEVQVGLALIPFFYWFKKEKKNIEQPIIVETVIKQTVVEEPVAKKAPVKKKINKKVNKK